VKLSWIHCGNCGHGWPLNRLVSDVERHAIEGNPCGKCSSYTLCLQEIRRFLQRGQVPASNPSALVPPNERDMQFKAA
jgi:hypothetical protein